jgi:hypothetical protein
MTLGMVLAFASAKSFSFDAFHLHHHSVLHDDRDLAELQAHQRAADMFQRMVELARIARRGRGGVG